MNAANTALPAPHVTLRTSLAAPDVAAIRELVRSTGMFSPAEIDIAEELAHEFLAKGDASGYRFVLAESSGAVIGFACFGQVPCTVTSYDLYWIAVRPTEQGCGIGRLLLQDAERRIAELGGTRIYVDTSGREAYTPTRAFYERTGYQRAAVLPDFYAPNDAKVIYLKVLHAATG